MWLAHPMFRCDDWNDLWFAARHGKVSGNHKPTKLVIFGFPKTWGPQFFIEILTHIFTIWPNCQTDDFLLGATVLRHSHILMITLLSRIVKTITAERIGSRRFSPKAKCDIGTACCALSIAREIVLTSRIFRWGRWNRSGHPRQSLRNCVFFVALHQLQREILSSEKKW